MNNFIDWDSLIVPSKDIQVTKMRVFDNDILVLDNVLTEESFSNLSEVSKTLSISQYNEPPLDRGFIDARFNGVQQLQPIVNIVLNCVRQYWSAELATDPDFTWAINYFKSLDTSLPFIGGAPHVDGVEGVAALMYLNKHKVEGTAMYKSATGVSRVRHPRQGMSNSYSYDYRFTAKNFEDNFSAREVIPGEPNRMLIYNRDVYHAASHTENEHTTEYRRTLVSFYSALFSYSEAE